MFDEKVNCVDFVDRLAKDQNRTRSFQVFSDRQNCPAGLISYRVESFLFRLQHLGCFDVQNSWESRWQRGIMTFVCFFQKITLFFGAQRIGNALMFLIFCDVIYVGDEDGLEALHRNLTNFLQLEELVEGLVPLRRDLVRSRVRVDDNHLRIGVQTRPSPILTDDGVRVEFQLI